jgi:NTP pyrophosphatase (non-canonical NTP hydrolase)
MTFSEYQEFASKGILNAKHQEPLLNFALGLTGETGEVVDLIKKQIFQGHIINPNDFLEELGDVLWYVANIASECGINLEAVAINNRRKLEQRYKEEYKND